MRCRTTSVVASSGAYAKSPIEPLGYQGWPQYSTFKHHLRIPLPYLKVVVKNYRDLTEVPILLPALIEKIDQHLWSAMQDVEFFEKKLKVAGVPVPYIRNEETPVAGVKVTAAYELMLEDVSKILNKPLVLYFHSGFESAALQAASNVVKAAVKNGVVAKMVSFGKLLEETKKFEANNDVSRSVDSADLLCLYMVGTEYTTEFSTSVLKLLLQHRRTEGKPTLVVSHLDSGEFKKRYDFDLNGVVLKWEDPGMVTTVDELIKCLKG